MTLVIDADHIEAGALTANTAAAVAATLLVRALGRADTFTPIFRLADFSGRLQFPAHTLIFPRAVHGNCGPLPATIHFNALSIAGLIQALYRLWKTPLAGDLADTLLARGPFRTIPASASTFV